MDPVARAHLGCGVVGVRAAGIPGLFLAVARTSTIQRCMGERRARGYGPVRRARAVGVGGGARACDASARSAALSPRGNAHAVVRMEADRSPIYCARHGGHGPAVLPPD